MTTYLLIGTLAPAVVSSRADVLNFKQGGGMPGILVSADANDVVSIGATGGPHSYPRSALTGIDFSTQPPTEPVAPQTILTIPAGAQIAVRMIDAINGATAVAGALYRAGIDDTIGVGSLIAVSPEAICTIEAVSVQSGKELALRLKAIDVGGKSYSTSTNYAR